MGSANLNDRSQKGDGDSEIALVVEDTEQIESWMDGNQVARTVMYLVHRMTLTILFSSTQYIAARFAATLRRKLYRGMPSTPVSFSFFRK